jgi:hypothetical protein
MRHSCSWSRAFAGAGIALGVSVIYLGLVYIIVSSHAVERFVQACALVAQVYVAYQWFREKRVPKRALNLAAMLTGLAILPELMQLLPGYVAEGAIK